MTKYSATDNDISNTSKVLVSILRPRSQINTPAKPKPEGREHVTATDLDRSRFRLKTFDLEGAGLQFKCRDTKTKAINTASHAHTRNT